MNTHPCYPVKICLLALLFGLGGSGVPASQDNVEVENIVSFEKEKGWLISSLVWDEGNLYGATQGLSQGLGSIFQVTPFGELTTLYYFPLTEVGTPPERLLRHNSSLFGSFSWKTQVFHLDPDGDLAITRLGSETGGIDDVPAKSSYTEFVVSSSGELYASQFDGKEQETTIFSVDQQGEFSQVGVFPSVALKLDLPDNRSFYGIQSTIEDQVSLVQFTPPAQITRLASIPARVTGKSRITTVEGETDTTRVFPNLLPQLITLTETGEIIGFAPRGGDESKGLIFKYTEEDELSILLDFQGEDVQFPLSLLSGRDGNLYGTTPAILNPRELTVSTPASIFRLSPEGDLRIIHQFDPEEGIYHHLISQPDDQTLWGFSPVGGDQQSGAIFKLAID